MELVTLRHPGGAVRAVPLKLALELAGSDLQIETACLMVVPERFAADRKQSKRKVTARKGS